MTLSVTEMRDRLFDLDLGCPEDQEEYNDLLYSFILLNEGSRAQAYVDTVGKVTVGIGFNMDASTAPAQWNQAFGGSVSFDDVYHKRRNLSECEIRTLFDLSITVRRQEVKKIYAAEWDQLPCNIRVGIEDAYFNAPSLVGPKTHFHLGICNFVQTGDEQYLGNAIYEIKDNSNPTHCPGLQHRRDRQAEMLSLPAC